MRGWILLFLLLASLQAAAQEQLNIGHNLPEVLDLANCGSDTGPVSKAISFSVVNEWDNNMILDYEYYDFPSASWRNAGRLCFATPKQLTKCDGALRVAFGGKGNGTVTHDLLRLTARNERTGETVVKNFSFIVNHFPGDKENARMSELNATLEKMDALNATLNTTCYGDVCCGLAQERESLKLAREEISEGASMLTNCELNELYLTIVNATSNVNRANSTNLSACLSALPSFNEARGKLDAAGAALRAGAACHANVLTSNESLQNGEGAYANASRALRGDNYSAALAFLGNASGLAAEAEGSVGECGGAIWTAETPSEMAGGQNTTGGVSALRPSAGEAGAASNSQACLGGLFSIMAASAFAAFAKR